MKAILLAGGEGTRLRPLTAGLPKPMVPLFDRPVLEHLLLLLRRHGIRQAAVTLGYLPQAVTDYFGDGSRWGMELTYRTERTPLGTAGGVRACLDFLEGEDCIVLSGDCVCDFDLGECIREHCARRAEATLLLCRVSEPLEYGLVLTDERGRITRFAEKPDWSGVFTNLVNTGIYLLSHRVVEEIPAGKPCDFASDLFPRLLVEGRGLYGALPAGYWRDMGQSESYLQAMADALEGKVRLDLRHPEVRPGVWSGSLLPEDAHILPPCWVGENVVLGRDCLLGPHAVLGRGSSVGDGSVIQHSALLGARAGGGNTMYGAILCPGAQTQADAVLSEGAVLGGGVRLGTGAILRPGVKVWPEIEIPARARLNASVTAPQDLGRLCFGEDGVLRGVLGLEITAQTLMALGGVLAEEGRCGLGWGGGDGAQTLALAARAGLAAAGADVFLHGGSTPAAAGWCAGFYALPISLYLWQRGEEISLYLFSSDGLPLGQARRRRLETCLLTRTPPRADAGALGRQEHLRDVDRGYANEAARFGGGGPLPPLAIAVDRIGAEGALLADSLERLGCRLTAEREGVAAFYSQMDGFGLCARDEKGRLLRPEWVQMLCCLVLLEQGERTLALPESAPVLAGRLAEGYRARLLRLGRDGAEAARVYRRLLPLRDGCAAACLLAGQMAGTGQTLARLADQLPHMSLRRHELPLTADRGAVMEALLRAFPQAERLEAGLRLTIGGGSVWLAPAAARAAVQIRAEGGSEEIAAELCDTVSRKIKEVDHL